MTHTHKKKKEEYAEDKYIFFKMDFCFLKKSNNRKHLKNASKTSKECHGTDDHCVGQPVLYPD